MSARSKLILTTVVLAGMLLAGCGNFGGGGDDTGGGGDTAGEDAGSGGDTSGDDAGGESGAVGVLADASAKTTEAGSARMAMDVKIGGPDGGEPMPFFTGKAKFDPANNKGVMTLTIVGLAGLGDLAGGGAGGGGAGGGGAAPAQRMLIIGDVVYQESAVPLPGGKRWLRIDASQVPAQGGSEPAAAGGSPATGQSASLTSAALWLDGVTEATEVGPDEIRDGESATKYEAVIDVEKAAAASDEAAASLQGFDALGVTSFDTTVWLDDQGRMRQLAYTLTTGEGAQAGFEPGTRLDYLVEVWDFGVKVNVKEPPAGQVADFNEVLEHMEQNLGNVQGDVEDLASELGGAGGQ